MSIRGLSEYPPGSAGHCARVYRDRSPRATRPLVAASVNRPGVSHCLKPLRLGVIFLYHVPTGLSQPHSPTGLLSL